MSIPETCQAIAPNSLRKGESVSDEMVKARCTLLQILSRNPNAKMHYLSGIVCLTNRFGVKPGEKCEAIVDTR